MTRGGAPPRATPAAWKISTPFVAGRSGDFTLGRLIFLRTPPVNLSRTFFGVVGEGGRLGSVGPVFRRKSAKLSSLGMSLCFLLAPGYMDNSGSSESSSSSTSVVPNAGLVLGDGGYR